MTGQLILKMPDRLNCAPERTLKNIVLGCCLFVCCWFFFFFGVWFLLVFFSHNLFLFFLSFFFFFFFFFWGGEGRGRYYKCYCHFLMINCKLCCSYVFCFFLIFVNFRVSNSHLTLTKGKLGLAGAFCMGGPGVIMSRDVVLGVAPGLRDCLGVTVTGHEDTELGRCITINTGVQCATNYEVRGGCGLSAYDNLCYHYDLLSFSVFIIGI